LVWGDHPVEDGVDTPGGDLAGGASALALLAARDFFRESSAPGSQLMNYLDGIYPATVTYFGKAMAKSDVLADKQTFVERWPERLYTIDPNNLSASCAPDGKCTATGTVALRAHSPERQRTSVVTAKFALTFDTSGSPALVGESSALMESEELRRDPPCLRNRRRQSDMLTVRTGGHKQWLRAALKMPVDARWT
jgi:hypothetical protein